MYLELHGYLWAQLSAYLEDVAGLRSTVRIGVTSTLHLQVTHPCKPRDFCGMLGIFLTPQTLGLWALGSHNSETKDKGLGFRVWGLRFRV